MAVACAADPDTVRGSALAAGATLAPSYAREAGQRFEQYRINRNYFHGLETRWREAPFWQRRHARSELQAA